MRRKEKEIVSHEEILALLDKCKVCRLGMSENNMPYIVPLNFGYEFSGDSLVLYFHCAHEGKKIDILKRNNKACFEVDCGHELLMSNVPCRTGFAYQSIIGQGGVAFLTDSQAKSHGLNVIFRHQTGRDDVCFEEKQLNAVTVLKLSVISYTGKQSGQG